MCSLGSRSDIGQWAANLLQPQPLLQLQVEALLQLARHIRELFYQTLVWVSLPVISVCETGT